MADFDNPVKTKEDSVRFFIDLSRPGASSEKVIETYSNTAKYYNQYVNYATWNAPKIGTEQLIRVVKDKEARILDAAAGTGLCGELLRKAGYNNLDALDASQEMLDEAAKLNVYNEIIKAYMGPNKLPIQDGTYDAVLAVAAFCPGQVKEDCYEELIRITKPDGLIIIVMTERNFTDNVEYGNKIEARMNELETAGAWTRLQREIVPGFWNNYNAVVYVLRIEQGKDQVLASLEK